MAASTNGVPLPEGVDPIAENLPLARLRQGTYVGLVIDERVHPMPAGSQYGEVKRSPWKLHAWRGVPFAQSTSYENRFKPPIPLNNTDQEDCLYSAWSLGHVCCDWYINQFSQGEDCLTIDIYSPIAGNIRPEDRTGKTSASSLLPVAIYVHGGAFNGGNGNERNMPAFAAWSESPIVAVSLNYRVGALGFLPSTFMAKRGLLNLGLRDQVAAFEWVRDNIYAFGGDKNKVTIMGLSAGAHSVGHHLNYFSHPDSERGRPAPFHRAILESGTSVARATYSFNHTRHEKQFQEFLQLAGLENIPEDELLAKLRSVPANILSMASRTVWDRYSYSLEWPFQPVIEPTDNELVDLNAALKMGSSDWAGEVFIKGLVDKIIPKRPIDSLSSPNRIQIPIIAGFQTNEGAIFIPANDQLVPYFHNLIPGFEENDLAVLDELYLPEESPGIWPDGRERRYTHPPQDSSRGLGPDWPRMEVAYAHYAYICPVLLTAHWWDTTWDKENGIGDASVYLYRFAAVNGPMHTANHADEGRFVARDPSTDTQDGLAPIGEAMNTYWTRFIAGKEGSPNEMPSGHPFQDGIKWKELPAWPRYASPFLKKNGEYSHTGADVSHAIQSKRNKINKTAGQGLCMVFGEGNDVQAGGSNYGITAQPEKISEWDRWQCDFWFTRVELSEGIGRRGADQGSS